VEHPHAYWCIVRHRQVIAEGREDYPRNTRGEVQELVALRVIQELVRVLTLSSS
jgi:hypothetical protein